jgi:hypothetical protein
MNIDVQALTLAEAVLLLLSNVVGGALALLAWRVSDVDVKEAHDWKADALDSDALTLARYNRLLVTEDARHGEARRFQSHILIGLVGVFWLLTPQPINPMVVWWAVAVRGVTVVLSGLLIDKTLAHLVARYRFDHPERSASYCRSLWPALWLAHRDVWTRLPSQRRTS